MNIDREQTIDKISTAYDPSSSEENIYKFWENLGAFTPTIDKDKKPFVMIMPPPNVTGELHMGHALTLAVEDLIVRWHRMKGDPTLFLPGTDHAGIATQVVVERLLASEGTSRHNLGRDDFEKRIWEWVNRYGNRIYEQIRRMGTSCDWTRKSFTLDPGPRKAVRKTFVDLYNKGLIYQGERITNWCTRCATVLSDLEVRYKDTNGALYKIRYPLVDGNGEIIVATTRPETMLGDTAVATNPEDTTFSQLQGKHVRLPLTNRTIPIITDSAVELDFGTGALKVTPAHDQVDFEIGERHNLDVITVIDPEGKMNHFAGKYEGLDRIECRKKIVADLKSEGFLVETENYNHSVGHCERCDDLLEPSVTKQWYVSMEGLASPAINAIRDGKINIVPDRFKSVYFNWMENIRDWPVSRQLWWGHQLPVWYCKSCDAVLVEYEDPTSCNKCQSEILERDPDVLDTWFSSGLWTHSTLGWPESTEDLDYFYPGSVMETGYDILFFWVARMIMMGIENMGEPPFETVYLHGLVLDPEGVKMSKTKGNVLDPIELIEAYGADAIRFALTTGTAAGNNLRMNEQKLEASRNFANKLWNASRFVISNVEASGYKPKTKPIESKIHRHDKWINGRLNQVKTQVEQYMNDFQFGEAQTEIHDFLWNEYCDWYIELAKLRLRKNDPLSPIAVLSDTLEQTLRLLHPFLPFVTEEIWQKIRGLAEDPKVWPAALMISEYPDSQQSVVNSDAIGEMESVFELIRAIRNIRGEFKIKPRETLNCAIAPSSTANNLLLEEESEYIKLMAGISKLEILDAANVDSDGATMSMVVNIGTAQVSLGEDIDIEAEIKRLTEEKNSLTKYLASITKRLNNPGFVNNAPPEVVEKEKDRLNSSDSRIARLRDILQKLSSQ